MWRHRRGSGLVVGVACCVLAGCSPGSSAAPASPSAAPPSPTIQEPVAVHGVEECEIVDSDYSGNPLREKFHCHEVNGDARLVGEWESWILTTETGGGLGSWTGDLVMVNTGGTWQGAATGTTSGMPYQPVNLGIVVWTGQGGYAGLTYHEFVYGSNGRLDTAGWVEP